MRWSETARVVFVPVGLTCAKGSLMSAPSALRVQLLNDPAHAVNEAARRVANARAVVALVQDHILNNRMRLPESSCRRRVDVVPGNEVDHVLGEVGGAWTGPVMMPMMVTVIPFLMSRSRPSVRGALGRTNRSWANIARARLSKVAQPGLTQGTCTKMSQQFRRRRLGGYIGCVVAIPMRGFALKTKMYPNAPWVLMVLANRAMERVKERRGREEGIIVVEDR